MLRRGGTLQGTSQPVRTPDLPVAADAAVALAPVAAGLAVTAAPVALVEAARTGDRSAFETLVTGRLERCFRTARAILGSDADACDATQETFLRAWRELPRLRDPERFDAWLGRILVNACRETLRGRHRRHVREVAASDLVEPVETVASRDEGPEGRVASADALERAFERLSAADRSILALHHLQRLPLTDVAATLAIPVGTAKSRLFAARHNLERALEAELQ